MSSVTLKKAKEVTNQIVKTLRPFSVLLFGSVAPKKIGADLDLLIVTDEHRSDEGEAQRRRRTFYEAINCDCGKKEASIARRR